MKPILTVLLFIDVEKDPEMVRRFYHGMQTVNDPERVAILPFEQKRLHPLVDGYPVWDVMEVSRDNWESVDSDYVTWAHPEFFLCPGRLEATLDVLAAKKPIVALGNLRRPGDDPNQWKFPSCSKSVSDVLTRAIDAGDTEKVRELCVLLPTREWMYWSPPPKPGPCKWLEDIFFARKDFLDAIGFMRDHGPMPFQDVYDLMGETMKALNKRGLMPECLRLSREEHEAIHLWHPKGWNSFTPAMRDWFMARGDQYRDTTLLRRDLWDRLIGCTDGRMPKDERPVIDFRRGPGGAVTRHTVGVSAYLQNGGADVVRRYYAERTA